MTSYAIERPARGPRRPVRYAHLRLGEAQYGQPVTVEITDEEAEESFPAVFVRVERGMMRCAHAETGATRLFFPREVFPRREAYRRWVAMFHDKHNGINVPVPVTARTHLEAYAAGVVRLSAKFGESAKARFTFRSATKRG